MYSRGDVALLRPPPPPAQHEENKEKLRESAQLLRNVTLCWVRERTRTQPQQHHHNPQFSRRRLLDGPLSPCVRALMLYSGI